MDPHGYKINWTFQLGCFSYNVEVTTPKNCGRKTCFFPRLPKNLPREEILLLRPQKPYQSRTPNLSKCYIEDYRASQFPSPKKVEKSFNRSHKKWTERLSWKATWKVIDTSADIDRAESPGTRWFAIQGSHQTSAFFGFFGMRILHNNGAQKNYRFKWGGWHL